MPAPPILPEKPASPDSAVPPAAVGRLLAAPLPQKGRTRGVKAKFATLERLDIRLRKDQIDFLTGLELDLRRRDNGTERITKASIVRAVLDILPHLDLDLTKVVDEDSFGAQILTGLKITGDSHLATPSKRP